MQFYSIRGCIAHWRKIENFFFVFQSDPKSVEILLLAGEGKNCEVAHSGQKWEEGVKQ